MAARLEEERSDDLVAISRSEREKRGFFARIALFFQQVWSELKKVQTPTRRELFTYSLVVLIFVVIMMAFVWLLDWGYGALVLFVFGRTGG